MAEANKFSDVVGRAAGRDDRSCQRCHSLHMALRRISVLLRGRPDLQPVVKRSLTAIEADDSCLLYWVGWKYSENEKLEILGKYHLSEYFQ